MDDETENEVILMLAVDDAMADRRKLETEREKQKAKLNKP